MTKAKIRVSHWLKSPHKTPHENAAMWPTHLRSRGQNSGLMVFIWAFSYVGLFNLTKIERSEASLQFKLTKKERSGASFQFNLTEIKRSEA